jgi:hypothetical protein
MLNSIFIVKPYRGIAGLNYSILCSPIFLRRGLKGETYEYKIEFGWD